MLVLTTREQLVAPVHVVSFLTVTSSGQPSGQVMRRLSLGLFLIIAASSVLLISDWKQRRAPVGNLPRVAIVQQASQGIIDEGVRGIVEALADAGFVDQTTI